MCSGGRRQGRERRKSSCLPHPSQSSNRYKLHLLDYIQIRKLRIPGVYLRRGKIPCCRPRTPSTVLFPMSVSAAGKTEETHLYGLWGPVVSSRGHSCPHSQGGGDDVPICAPHEVNESLCVIHSTYLLPTMWQWNGVRGALLSKEPRESL